MDQLSDKMRERLEKWRQTPTSISSPQQFISPIPSRRNGKNDYGDVMTLEEWEKEAHRSQTRR